MSERLRQLRPLLTLIAGLVAGYFGFRLVPHDTAPPAPPAPPPSRAADPTSAIGKVQMGNGYCSGTVVTDLDDSGRQFVLSAAHCFSSVGEGCEFRSRGGRVVAGRVVGIDKRSDAAIVLIRPGREPLPWVPLAAKIPVVGSPVYHAGYGFDSPQNREDGTVSGGLTSDGKLQYRLSVSNGDSGGGIIASSSGEVLSPVCCTTRIAGTGDVFGASPLRCLEMLTAARTEQTADRPIAIPQCGQEVGQ